MLKLLTYGEDSKGGGGGGGGCHVYFKQYFTLHEFEREYCKIHASRINFGPNRVLRINSFSPSMDWLVNFQIERI